ncbi:hippurate hydrolase [Podospora fimiseda]|uniref:Hippurate hydrolase n=1 Tax=Podospora fimiseda TaxID=252190 RepID=A0AAN6YRW2_9PEZI|nr:hippurate hydrolase [Podospora fimiseda]
MKPAQLLVLPLVLQCSALALDNIQFPITGSCMDLGAVVRKYCPELSPLEALYKHVHQHPELSGRELQTASLISEHLRGLGLNVTKGVGGHGVVGVLRNGDGPVVLLRAELDALPIQELTGLPFASTQFMEDSWGRRQPVMHACGHDMHMASLMGAAQLLLNARSEWTGTVVVLFQPNEEHTGGAQAMIDDGLYEKIGIAYPDAVFAQHLMQTPTGSVSIKPGPVLVSAETVRIRMFSSEGYIANPQRSVDVSVVVSKVILALQELVREVSKGGSYASIYTEEMHAGEPGADWVSHADIVLDVKAYDPAIRSQLLNGIKLIVEREASISGAVRRPEITVSERAPLTTNNPDLSKQLRGVFTKFFGHGNVLEGVPTHPCEDFSRLATPVGAPYVFWFLGRADPRLLDRARKDGVRFADVIPIEHSPYNAPLIHPTLETGIYALSLAALSVLTVPSS